jgi:tRNA-specific 2-thiouridylase
MCNRYVKFGGFLKWAKEQGADYVATGHYARVLQEDNEFKLLTGVDQNKDQSYFLWTLNQKDLPNILFPVGHLTKPEVRKLAEELGLPTASKKDSQGLCFIGKVDVKEFLSHYIETKSGNVLNEKGEVIGTHPGALFFTNGERRGFVIDHKNKTPNDNPYFVIDKDVDQNTITVSNKAGDTLPGGERQVTISHVNWVGGSVPDFDVGKEVSGSNPSADSDKVEGNWVEGSTSSSSVKFPLQARSRYRQPLQKIRIVSANISETALEFENVQDTLTSGQSLVIYDGEECLGGGVIG